MSSGNDRKFFRSQAEKVVPSGAGLSAFLRNRHPHDTVFWVSSLTGVAATTVEKWLGEACLPQLRHLGPLIGAYGPALLAAVFPSAPGWLDEATRVDRLRALEAEHARQAEEIARLRG